MREYAILAQREVLVEVELGRLTEDLEQPDHDQHAHDQVHYGEYFVEVTMLLDLVVARNVIAKTNCWQWDEAVVECVQIGPALDVSVNASRYQEEENEHDKRTREREHDMHVRSLEELLAEFVQHGLELVNEELEHHICRAHEPLDYGIEKYHGGRYAQNGEDHAEELAKGCLRVDVTVSDGGEHGAAEEHGLAERPVGLLGDIADGGHAVVVRHTNHPDERVELVVGEALVVASAELPHELVEIADDPGLVGRLERVEDQRAKEQVEHVNENEERETLVCRLKQSCQHCVVSRRFLLLK